MTTFASGFAVSLSLIMAIGAQNAFVLRQGVTRRHVELVVLICILSEAILIASGVAGFGALMEATPWIEPLAKWGGAAFLIVYGALSARRALTETQSLVAGEGPQQTARSAVLTCLALTWLNPHVYLDTVVLLGAIAAQYGDDRWAFGAGALAASTVFFVALGYGATLLAPVFARPAAWRVLDMGVAVVMWSIALALVAG
ncbi:LysE/ArgO family amino acid transporter [Silicimonas algicola]|uniref:L-lysine exporter family protein LysE/ArgO n=1 Tax=Silicimonas algicola TaxID=1826607 RepID=A0A316G791_9RHOB|nr:LysE/ArgO family amino acid transporter [Silicimonas algicola]PWK56055.1 L-lysine exporter family protein LysE/ArgO [Silicimonas algicola]